MRRRHRHAGMASFRGAARPAAHPRATDGGVAYTLRQIRRWRQEPNWRSSGARKSLHFLLPLIPNLALIALPVSLLASGLLGMMRLFMPDFTWISLICGGFCGAVWALVRSGLVIATLRHPASRMPLRRSSVQTELARRYHRVWPSRFAS